MQQTKLKFMKRTKLKNNHRGASLRKARTAGRAVAAMLVTAMMTGALQAVDWDHLIINDTTVILEGTEDGGVWRYSRANNVTLVSGTLLAGDMRPEAVALELMGGIFDAQSGSIMADLVGTGVFTKSGFGTTVELEYQSTFTGEFQVLEGTLQTNVDNAFANASGLRVSGTLNIQGTTQSVMGDIHNAGYILGTGTLSSSVSGKINLNSGVVEAVLGDYIDELDPANNKVNSLYKNLDDSLGILANVNTYTGYTVINGGTLQVTVNNAIAASFALQVLGAGASFDIAGTEQEVRFLLLADGKIEDTVGGGRIISLDFYDVRKGTIEAELGGNESLRKTGADTVDLNAVASYTGLTSVSEGRLRTNVNNALVSSLGVNVDGNTAVFDVAGTTQTVQYVRLQKGVLDDSVGGGVLISDNHFTLDSGDVNVELSGSAFLHKTSHFTVNLNVANSYTGYTIVTDGVLNLFASSALSTGSIGVYNVSVVDIKDTGQAVGNIYVDSDAAILMGDGGSWGTLITFTETDPNFTSEIRGAITGNGWFGKHGKGDLLLSGTIDIAGSIAINEGAIILVENDGYNIGTSGVWIGDNGALAGNGVILGDIVNHNIVAPGRALGNNGRITAANYLPAPTGNLVIGIRSANENDRLVVTGVASLDGTLTLVNRGHKLSRNDKWKVLEAASIESTFSKLTHNFGNTMLQPTIRYTANEVWVEVEQQSFRLVGKTPNQRAVGRALDHAAKRGQLERLFDYANYLDPEDVPAFLDLLAPEQLAAIFNIGFSTAQTQNINIERRLDDVRNGARGFSAHGLALTNSRGTLNYDGLPIVNERNGLSLAGFDGKSVVGKQPVAPVVTESRWGFFITGSGEWTDIETTYNARGSQLNSGGITVGADYRVSDNLVVGVNFGYAHTDTDLVRNGRIEANGGRGGVYASLFGNGAYLNVAVDGGYNSYRLRRGTLGGIARGDTEGGSFNSLLGGGYDFSAGCFTFGPVASLQYGYVGFSGYQESGSDVPLRIRGGSQDSLRTMLGAKVAAAWNVGGVVIRPEVRAQWKHEFLDREGAIDSSFTGSGALFTVHGPEVGRDSLVIDAGATVQFNDRLSVYAFYTGEIGRTNYSSNSVNGGFRVSF